MSFEATCPECEKSTRLRDDVANKKIKCPKCGTKFLAKSSSSRPVEDDETYATEEARRPPGKKRSNRRDDDDDEHEDRPRKKTARAVPQAPTPMAPMVCGILAILLLCGPIGAFVGFIALNRIAMASDELPAGRGGATARRNLKIAWTLAIAGIVVNAILTVVAITLKVMNWF